ncbi:response regulator [Luteimonas sp. S4-F44]|uniref:response regulator n=1 Tax=Luteimonas sp. S4-F44 TaxID=2925842 RepID=UPI001F52D616|nr:response regulator [Luteimonas sp. S4-F44]UNK43842.1 response regulator [Luteimonas sp. S4-F44]
MPRLLLVEDDPTSRSFLLAAASSLPAEVDVAATVADALTLAATDTHDAWLIDANLPDGSGIELLARLRAQGLDTPALAHTAERERESLDALRAAGFLLALSKPVTAANWRAAIRTLVAAPVVAPPPPPRPIPADEDLEPSAAGRPAVWNTRAALAAVGGNAGNADALRGLFLGELPQARDGIVLAARRGDTPAMRSLLHKLRAGCGFVGADRLCAAAALLHAAPASEPALHRFLAAIDATLAAA